MPLTWRQTLAMLVTVGAILGASGSVCPAASLLSRSPQVVTMSGTFQPFNEHESHDLDTLTVTIDDKQQWLFRVNRVDTATGTNPGVMLLSEIFPPQLRIMGSTSNMAVLERNRTLGGKRYRAVNGGEVSGKREGAGSLRIAAVQAAVK